MTRLLLDQPGFCYNLQNAKGETALHWTVRAVAFVPILYGGWLCIKHTPTYLKTVKMLIKAGCCATVTAANGETPFTVLLRGLETMKKENRYLEVDKSSVTVDKAIRNNDMYRMYCDCLILLLSAGACPSETDHQLMTSELLQPLLTASGLRAYAASKCERPASLRRLSKLCLRRHVRKPLPTHVPATGLPRCLQKYVLLEVND